MILPNLESENACNCRYCKLSAGDGAVLILIILVKHQKSAVALHMLRYALILLSTHKYSISFFVSVVGKHESFSVPPLQRYCVAISTIFMCLLVDTYLVSTVSIFYSIYMQKCSTIVCEPYTNWVAWAMSIFEIYVPFQLTFLLDVILSCLAMKDKRER